MRVELIDKHGCTHAEGEISDKLVAEISIIERNERFYMFYRLHVSVVIFMETNPPTKLTEF